MWVEDHPHRVFPLYIPDRQAWVVGGDGTGPDDYGVDERSQPVQPADVGRPGDIVGMPVLGGDPPIQALPDLADHQIGAELEWQIEVEQVACRIGHVAGCGPPTEGSTCNHTSGLG